MSQVQPADDINLHFTGDMHAVSAATNLLAAMIDNHVKRELSPKLDPQSILWRRTVDMSDKALYRIRVGMNGGLQGPDRETGFDLASASEVMGILTLATGISDMVARLDRIVIGHNPDHEPVTAKDIGASGAMAALLRDAIRPNLAQTSEGTPAILHAGPFANIAPGNSSVLADRLAVRLADFVVTESGFGSDCGAEKLFHIKGAVSGIIPDVEVLLCTARALKWHSGDFGTKPRTGVVEKLLKPNMTSLEKGLVNLAAHLDNLKQFGFPVVVAINRFPDDDMAELDRIKAFAVENGAESAHISEVFSKGGAGGEDLARGVVAATRKSRQFRPLYNRESSLVDKIRTLATKIYGAADVEFSEEAEMKLERFTRWGFGSLPVCIAKTQYSLSHDPEKLGRPKGFTFPIRDAQLYAGAGYVMVASGETVTMPGLPKDPSAKKIWLDESGEIHGLR